MKEDPCWPFQRLPFLKKVMTNDPKDDTFRYLVLFNCQRKYNFKGFLKEILRYTFVTNVTSNNLESFKLQ